MPDELRGTARYLTAKDIAAELSVSLTTAYEIVRQCTRVVVGRVTRVSRANFEVWKRRHEEPPDAQPQAPREKPAVRRAPERAHVLSPHAPLRMDRPWTPRPKKARKEKE